MLERSVAYQPGQNGHGGQMYFFVTEVVVGRAGAVAQHSPSEQHDAFAAVLVLALAVKSRQSGGHTGEQPGGQVGASQQSTAFTSFARTGALAPVKQSGGQSGEQQGGQTSEQPGGQVRSLQQSPAFVLRTLARASPAHTPPAVRDSTATASIQDRLVIG